ncbi:MAG: hypothetical protein LBI14_10530 [Treponema sp.]|nr:hypothetical protein [Treponema sp.]
MKKLVLVLVLSILMAGVVFADHPSGFGVGVQGGGSGNWQGGGGLGYGAGLSLKLPSLPIFWTIGLPSLKFGGGVFLLDVSGDYYMIDAQLVPSIGLNWYFGLGVGVTLGIGGGQLGLGATLRVPVGISFQPFDLLEIYLQVVPNIGVWILPKFDFPYGGWGANLGVRFWF